MPYLIPVVREETQQLAFRLMGQIHPEFGQLEQLSVWSEQVIVPRVLMPHGNFLEYSASIVADYEGGSRVLVQGFPNEFPNIVDTIQSRLLGANVERVCRFSSMIISNDGLTRAEFDGFLHELEQYGLGLGPASPVTRLDCLANLHVYYGTEQRWSTQV